MIKKPHILLRMLLGLISFVLCLLLFVTSLTSIVIADIQVIGSKDTMNTIISQLLTAPAVPAHRHIAGAAIGVNPRRLAESERQTNELQEMIIEAAYDMLSDMMGEEAELSLETVKEFYYKSTLPEFLADKLSGIISDIYLGEITTTLTAEEVMQVLRDNAPLVKEYFQYEITEEDISAVGQVIAENDFMPQIHEIVEGSMNGNLGGSGEGSVEGDFGGNGTTTVKPGTGNTDTSFISGIFGENTMASALVSDLMGANGIGGTVRAVRTLSSSTYLYTLLGVCAALFVLILLVNYYKIPSALRATGFVVFFASLFFAVPTAVVMYVPMGDSTVITVAQLILTSTMPVTLTALGIGLVLFVAGVVLGIVLRAKRKAALAPTAPMTPAEVVAAVEAVDAEAPVAVSEAPASSPAMDALISEINQARSEQE